MYNFENIANGNMTLLVMNLLRTEGLFFQILSIERFSKK